MSDIKRATDDLLDLLHGTVADELIAEIKAYRNGERFHPTKFDKEGNPLPRDEASLPASLVAQAIKFLKDNGIDRPHKKGDKLDLLADELDEEFGDNVTAFPTKG